MSYVNFNRALTRAQIEALGTNGNENAVNGKIYFAKDGGIYVGNSNGVAERKADYTPLMSKTYDPYTCTAASVNKGYIFFMNVVPTSDNWYEPWYITYRLKIETPTAACQGYYEITVGSAGTTSQYHIFNKFYSTSYYPSYYHLMAWYNSAAKYANRSTYPIKFGERIYSAYGATTVSRTYTIEVIDIYNCTVSFPDNIETYDSFYTDTEYGYCSTYNATTVGTLDNYDANTNPNVLYEQYTYYKIHDNTTPLYRYKYCGWDEENRLVPIDTTNQTTVTCVPKTPTPVPMKVSKGLVFYSLTTNITVDTALTPAAAIYKFTSITNNPWTYNFSEVPGLNKTIYLVGDYDPNTDNFTLDTTSSTSFYKFVELGDFNTSDYIKGKYYWYVAITSAHSSYTNYGKFDLDHPLYYFDGEQLIPAQNHIISDPSETISQEIIDNGFTIRELADGKVNANSAKITKAYGNSVVWNQMFNDTRESFTQSGITFDFSPGQVRLHGTTTANLYYDFCGFTKNHKYYLHFKASTYRDANDLPYWGIYNAVSPTPNLGDEYKGIWTVLTPDNSNCSITPNGGQGFKSGNTIDVTAYITAIDLTLLFGSGYEPSTVEEFEKIYREKYYEYNPGILVDNNTYSITSTRFLDDSGSGEEDDDKTAIIKLSELPGGGLRKAGDAWDEAVYNTDDTVTVTRRTIKVDMGTLTWIYVSGAFYTNSLSSSIERAGQFISSLYQCIGTIASSSAFNNAPDKTIMQNVGSGNWPIGAVLTKDSTYTDAATFKAAMSGVELICELAEPITETYTIEGLKTTYNCENGDSEIQGPYDPTLTAPFRGEIEYTHTGLKDSVVRTVPQTLTSEQKRQARKNIDIDGTLSSEAIGDIEDPDNSWYTRNQMDAKLNLKQNTLVSGSNIKTVAGQSIVGGGNVDIPSDVFWAVYDETTYDEIYDAYTSGKNVLCKYAENIIVQLNSFANNTFIFNRFDIEAEMEEMILTVDQNDSWNEYYWYFPNSDLSPWRNRYNNQYNALLKNKTGYRGTPRYSVAEGEDTIICGQGCHVEGRGSQTESTFIITNISNSTYTTNISHNLKVGQFVSIDYSRNSSENLYIVVEITAENQFRTNLAISPSPLNKRIYIWNGVAFGNYSHAEGYETVAIGGQSHAEGESSRAVALGSHAEGSVTITYGDYSHSEGVETETFNDGEHAEGQHNISISGVTQHTVGIGDDETKKNAHTITIDGKHYIPGVGTYQGTETTLPTGQDLASVINTNKSYAGSTDTSNKIYLVGATTQTTASQTYSDNEVYVENGAMTTKSVQVGNGAATIQYDSTNECIKFIFN